MALSFDSLTAAQIAAGVDAGDFTATEVAQASLAAIEAREGGVQAFLQVAPELALEAAARVDADRAAGKPLPPLAGVPLAIKDNMNLVGTRTTCASRSRTTRASTPPPASSACSMPAACPWARPTWTSLPLVAPPRARRSTAPTTPGIPSVCPAALRAVPLPPSPQARSCSRWARTPVAPFASRRRCAAWWALSPRMAP